MTTEPTTLSTLAALDGQKTSDQARAFGLSPLAFGNLMKGLVKAGHAEKAEIPEGFSYALTAEARALLAPTSPATAPKKSAPKGDAKFFNGEIRRQSDSVYTVRPQSPARLEQLGFREVALDEIKPFVVARAFPKLEQLAVGDTCAVELGAAFFATARA